MSNRLKHFYEFGAFRFDPERKVLYQDGESVLLPPKATDVLAVLLEERGNLVEREQLLNAVWQDTFVEDGNLNNAVSTLRKILGGNGIIQTVPRRGYRFTADVSRVAEEEIEEIVVEKRTVTETTLFAEAPQQLSLTTPATPRYLAVAFGVVLLLVFAGVALMILPWRGAEPVAGGTKSVAIIPFRNLSVDPPSNDRAVINGITENLASRLASLKDTVVFSTRASGRLAEIEADPIAIGRRLGADVVIEGSLQNIDGKLNLIARMLNVGDGTQLWAGNLQSSESEILSLQDELVVNVATALSTQISSEEQDRLAKRPTEDEEAYKLYLRGRNEWNKRSVEGLRQSVGHFRAAIDRDPSFSLAYTGLADAYAVYADYNVEAPKDAFPKAKAAALKALELDPSSVRARTTLAYVQATFEWDYAAAEREYKAAIQAQPNYATAHQWYSEMLCALKRYDEAEAEIERAVELDPLVPITLSERAVLHYYRGDLDASLARFTEIKREHPDFATSYSFSAWIYGLKGQEEKAFEEEFHFLKLQGTSERVLEAIQMAYHTGGYRAFLQKRVEAHVREVENGAFPGYKIPHAYARLRDRERTLYWIERCIEARSPNIIKIASDRNFDFVRDDPRFQTAIAKLNIPT